MVPVVLFDEEGRYPGNLNVLLEFHAEADDATGLRDLYRNAQGGKQVNYLSPKIQNDLTDCLKIASALASGCKVL